ncbi:hypothetical protein [Rhizobium arsenicireducens]
MKQPRLSDALANEALEAFAKVGTKAGAARALGLPPRTFGRRYDAAIDRLQEAGSEHAPEILAAAAAGGIRDPNNLSHFWKITKDEQGNGYSLFVKNPKTGSEVSVLDLVRETVRDTPSSLIHLPQREITTGEHLLIIDLADVHFLKLCVNSETGYEYNREIARHRVIEGTKALLRMAKPWGIARVLFVMGNDILHVDNTISTTTSGTFQDSEGTIFQGFKDAGAALEIAINEASAVADVDLIHCMSNHDRVIGWTLTQAVAGRLRTNNRVRATDYNLSERHRKFYRFERNLFGLTHADGAKEEKLYGLMVTEAREHISECLNLYWLLHHFHHKIRKTRGEFAMLREKDHNGMTAFITGMPMIEGQQLNIEYVRSPSAPDGWHDRNGYINRQAVECFIHHPTLGQRARFTEWF